MRKATPIPRGTIFGRLAAIEEARTASGLPATRCRCECSKTVIVRNDALRAGHTRSCGCLPNHKPLVLDRSLQRGEVPLGGKKARGRVAIVDDEDYDLVMQYRWHVSEEERPGHRGGPYARALVNSNQVLMHNLIAGHTGIDHANLNGLDNRRSNLRPATVSQNNMNQRKKRAPATSRYVGVSRDGARWRAVIGCGGILYRLGSFASEEAAAITYDIAARKLHGEYARLNFPDDPRREMPAPVARFCAGPDCGEEISARHTTARYCSKRCKAAATRLQRKFLERIKAEANPAA